MSSKNKTGIIAIVLAVLLPVALAIYLSLKLNESREKLNQAADIIESLGNASFTIDADIQDSIEINTSFRIPVSIPVHVRMNVSVNAPLDMNVPINRQLNIPFSVKINQMLPVDTVFRFPAGIQALVNDSIPLNSRMKIKFWPGMRIPFKVQGTVPFNKALKLDPGNVRVASNIPVRLSLSDSIPVFLDFSVPVKDTIPMNLFIDSDAQITFYTSLPVRGRLPLKMKTPVKVDFSKTPLKARFDSLARVMRKIM
ncbi:MAG: hypothetical protein V2A54_10405 [Bacteroidota bacterium]